MSGFLDLFMIRRNERSQFLYFLLLFFVIGAGMAIGRSTADALFFKRYGIEFLPVMFILLSFFLVLISTFYAAYADRIPSERYFVIFFTSLAALLVINWLLIALTAWEGVYPMYFLVYEVASELLLVHSGLYIAQNFETLQAKRLLPLILAGSQLGTIVGGVFLTLASAALGVQNMLIVWALLSTVAMGMILLHHRRYGVSGYFRHGRRSARRLQQAIDEIRQGIRFTRQSELLKVSSLALFFTVIAFYILCYSVNRVYASTFTTETELAAFFGMLTAATSVCALLIQLFITNRAIDRFGVKKMNVFFPVATLVCFVGLLASFTLPLAVLASFNKDALNPAVRNPVRNLFFQALPAYMQGRARAMSVALVMPAALLVTGGILWLAQQGNLVMYFLALGLIASLFYIYYSLRMNRAYVTCIVEDLRSRVFVRGGDSGERGKGKEREVFDELINVLQQADEDLALMAARSLSAIFAQQAVDPILKRLHQASSRSADQMLRLIWPYRPAQAAPVLRSLYSRGDLRLRASILMFLADLQDSALDAYIDEALDSDNPRLRIAGIYAVMQLPSEKGREQVFQQWRALFNSDWAGENFAAVDLFLRQQDARLGTELLRLMDRSDQRLLIKVLEALGRLGDLQPGAGERLRSLYHQYNNHQVRSAIMACIGSLSGEDKTGLLLLGLDDYHPLVRQAAVNTLLRPEQDKVGTLSRLIERQDLSFRALQSLIAKLVEIGAPTALLEELALDKAREAISYTIGLQILNAGNHGSLPDYELIHMVLSERVQQSIDLVLLILSPVETPERMGVVRAALQSRDARFIASASEVIRHLDNKIIARILGDILEERPLRNLKQRQPQFDRKTTIQDVLSWCSSQGDAWLASCAEYTFNRTRTFHG